MNLLEFIESKKISIEEAIQILKKQNTSEKNTEALKDKDNWSWSSEPSIKTDLGSVYQGNSLHFLHNPINRNSIDLIVTSPPFGLVRKKKYGNEAADKYCDWFRSFALGFQNVLKDNGSLVIDIGGSWIKGLPTRSLYHFDLLNMLCKEYRFHLIQEHYWWNPSKMPTPAEWVTIRRIRVKDAVNTVWWLSKTPWPKSDNRRILAPYTPSMKNLLKNGYHGQDGTVTRPSEHKISKVWGNDNKGSIPPNLLAIPNTSSNDNYQKFCRENNITAHPARFPSLLPEYFIRMLTNKGDTVLDPFGGSCVTGEVCERLQRRWLCCELNSDYIEGAKGRFLETSINSTQKSKDQIHLLPSPNFDWDKDAVKIAKPCAFPINTEEELDPEGGKNRRKGRA